MPVHVCQADYADPSHARAVVQLLDAYAQDAMGGGEALSEYARTHVVAALAARPTAFSVLAFASADASMPVGLANCIEGFSTFACQPLVNVHDLVVADGFRGQRIGERLLDFVAELARQRGACKVTLEVLQGNHAAMRLYQRCGFAPYELDPAMGNAQLLQRWLGPSPATV